MVQSDRDVERKVRRDKPARAPAPGKDVDAQRAEEDRQADVRDSVAASADASASARDFAAEVRDVAAEGAERALAVRGGRAAGDRKAAAGDREAASEDRGRARKDRTGSRQARKDAAQDRFVAAAAVSRLVERLLEAQTSAGDMRSIGEAQGALMKTRSLNEDEAVAQVAARAAHDHTELGSAARSIIAES